MRGFWRVLRWELFKLYRRPASYLGFVLALVFCVAVLIGFGWSDLKGKEVMGLKLDRSVYLNGPFYANFVLNVGFFAILPLLSATLAGGQLAGEARDGTLRAMLLRPPSRVTIYLAKAAATLLWTQLLITFLILLALLIGHVAYGGGGMLIYIWEYKRSGFWIIPSDQWPLMLVWASLGAGASLALVAGVALLLSTLTENPVAAHVGTLGAFFMSTVLQRLPDQLMGEGFKDLLPTSHMNFWHEAYRWYHPDGSTVDHARLWTDVAWTGGLAAVCFTAGLIVFVRRDITS
ncbi:MAG TPA: ABC transporter permease [Kofleriaceae bacterium]|nr:ABC transporter permease [Kofleriaceae bacterium]